MASLLFFGKLGDLAGGRLRNFQIPLAPQTIADVISVIEQNDPLLGAALRDSSVRFIVNERIMPAKTEISDKDEIAFLPPVSGG